MSDQEVNTSVKNWLSEVVKVDPDHYKVDEAYKFSNNRTFLSTDKSDSGIYE